MLVEKLFFDSLQGKLLQLVHEEFRLLVCHHLSQASGSPIPMLHPFFFDEPHRVLDTVLLVLGTSKIIWFKGSESPTSQLTLCYSTLQNILKAPKKNPLGLFQMMASDEHP